MVPAYSKMKAPARLLMATIPFLLATIPQTAKALPFNENCASMQAYANALNWKVPTRFSGFESIKFYNVNNSGNIRMLAECYGGYIQEASPMGLKVCQGVLRYRLNKDNSPAEFTWYAENCRYR